MLLVSLSSLPGVYVSLTALPNDSCSEWVSGNNGRLGAQSHPWHGHGFLIEQSHGPVTDRRGSLLMVYLPIHRGKKTLSVGDGWSCKFGARVWIPEPL